MIRKTTPIFIFLGLFLLLGMSGSSDERYKKLELFGEALERVKAYYVEEKSDEELIEAALDGMLSNLDPHSGFLNEEAFKDLSTQTQGKFGGLGIEVTVENKVVKVVSPIDETPAFKAGIKAGDYIIGLDGENIVGLTLGEAVKKMRGEPGTEIELTIRREKPKVEILKIKIVRDIIKIDAVKWEIKGDVGYVRIRTFNSLTTKQMKDGIRKIKRKLGPELKGLVLDLRSNPGGLLDEAISVTDSFIKQGEIVSTKARRSSDSSRFRATSNMVVDADLPIVVLINSGSASASEIVAGALQDHQRAIIMGTRSFGKGSVQTILPLTKKVAMRLTTSRYYTPSGRSIQGKGITPDIVVEQARVETIEDQGAHEDDLPGFLSSGQETNDEKAEGKKESDEKDSKKLVDYQLQRAIDLILGMSLYKQKR